MSRPINLKRVRKSRARDEKRARADENAVKFGRTKTEKQREAAQRTNDAHRLDGHKRDP
ncbi:MAG: DUF4169 family protein [Roseobacter sp.]|jgi:hypothetical protein|nr:DUF4169 family protein [Roseobacter sp.]